MRSKPVLISLAAVIVLCTVVALIGRGGGDEHDRDSQGIPAAVGTDAPIAYRIVYQTTTPDTVGTEEHVVHRPFDARVTVRDKDDKVISERWSTLGRLVTRSQGAEAVRIDTAIAPATDDVRPDRFRDLLVEAKQLVGHDETQQVGGRRCTFASEAGEIDTSDDGTQPSGDPVKVLVSRCVDQQGLVLEERWTTTTGDRVLTKRAVELEVGDDVPGIDVPDASPLGVDKGNGAVTKVDDHARPPFREAFELPTPEGFTFVGRYAVAPARLSRTPGAIPADADLALYTDVWRRGPDLLLLDQGATKGGAAPFDPSTRIRDVSLGALGQAELAGDLRSAEIRILRPDSGFVRLSGTIAPDELARLAGTLQVLQEAP